MIESYSAGHSDLMTKVKSVQSRLDVILGKPGSKVKQKIISFTAFKADTTVYLIIVRTLY